MIKISNKPELFQDTIVFQNDGEIFFYGLTNKKVAKTSKFNNNIYEQLKNAGFFITVSDTILKPVIHQKMALMLLLGRDCLLRCRYCYAYAGKDKAMMSQDIANYAIETYLKTQPAQPKVILFAGGEPTMNISVIKNLINTYGDRIQWLLTTSGVLSAGFLTWLINKKVRIGFSVDGPPAIQNYLRPLKNGEPSSYKIEESLKIWKQRSIFPTTIRATITQDSIDFGIIKILDYFKDQLGADTIHLEALYSLGRVLDEKNILKAPSNQEFVETIINALEWAKKYDKRIKTSALSYFLNPKIATHCGALSYQTVIVNHQGFITACSEVVDDTDENWSDFVLGKINKQKQEFDIDIIKLNKLASRVTTTMDSCQNCFAKYICRGGCAHKALVLSGDIFSPNINNCNFIKTIVPILIKRMATEKFFV